VAHGGEGRKDSGTWCGERELRQVGGQRLQPGVKAGLAKGKDGAGRRREGTDRGETAQGLCPGTLQKAAASGEPLRAAAKSVCVGRKREGVHAPCTCTAH